MLYVTYKKGGILRSTIMDRSQYSQLIKTNGVSDIQIHASESEMKNSVNESKGLPRNNQRFLLG